MDTRSGCRITIRTRRVCGFNEPHQLDQSAVRRKSVRKESSDLNLEELLQSEKELSLSSANEAKSGGTNNDRSVLIMAPLVCDDQLMEPEISESLFEFWITFGSIQNITPKQRIDEIICG